MQMQCGKCGTTFGIPPGTPAHSVLSCPSCQTHNSFPGFSPQMHQQPMQQNWQPMPSGAHTTVVSMGGMQQQQPQSIVRVHDPTPHYIGQVRCCWISAIVMGLLICIGSFYYGRLTVCEIENDDHPTNCDGALLKNYATLIAFSGALVALAVWALIEIHRSEVASARTGRRQKIYGFQLQCHLAWIFGTVIFVDSIIYLLAFNIIVLFAPVFFIPCFCGLAIGPIVWVNCCCYQKQLHEAILRVQVHSNSDVPLREVIVQ